MSAVFASILLSLSPPSIFNRPSPTTPYPTPSARELRRWDVAFNLFAITKGVRDMAFLDLPRGWTPRHEWGLRLSRAMPWSSTSRLVCKADRVTERDMQELWDRFVATRERLQHGVERDMGQRLGYLQPQDTRGKMPDGVLEVHLHWMDGDQSLHIRSEFGPQSIWSKDLRFEDVRRLHARLSKLARMAHPRLEARVAILLQ